jgi:hypothetical protein
MSGNGYETDKSDFPMASCSSKTRGTIPYRISQYLLLKAPGDILCSEGEVFLKEREEIL